MRQNKIDIRYFTKDAAHRIGNVFGSEFRSCHLIKKRQKGVIIIAIDHHHIYGLVGQCASRPKAAEAAADNDNFWSFVFN